MAISDNIQAVAEKIRDEVQNNNGVSDTAREVSAAATKAILGGTDDWVAYMKLFADPNNPAELARLIPTDGSTDPVRQTARAYLAANGMCTETTTGNLPNNVNDKLDL
jgi:hypothetical protein